MDRTRTLGGFALSIVLLTCGAAPATALALEPETKQAEAAQQDIGALKIMDAFVEKIGGRALIESIRSTKVSATMSIPMAGMTGTMTIMNKQPGMLSMVVELPGFGTQKSGFDGTHGWSTDDLNGPRLMTEEELKSLKEQADPASSIKYREQYPTIEYAGDATFEGAETDKIRLVDTDGNESFQYYAKSDGMLVGSSGVEPTPMGDINVTSVMSDYKEFGGMKVATKMVQKIGPQQIIVTIGSIEVNGVDDSAFVMPEEVKALVEASKKDD